MASASTGLWEIWTESTNSKDTGDVLFLECLEAGYSSKIFTDLPDDKLKATLSLINSILNDPKTRSKGLAIYNDFLGQINVSRLIGYQDALTSGLHLVIKGLDSSSSCSLLANFLPKCHIMSEVNQTITSAVIPKVLAHMCDDSSFQKTAEELQLVKVCLETYHGPCGPYRDRLEKAMIPLLDSDNMELVDYLSEVLPMLSYSGGGGNAGEKHIADWSSMLGKFMTTAYATLRQLFGDTDFTNEMDYDGEGLAALNKIVEPKPLLRMALLKRRLCNLLYVISGYLRSSFPAPKHIPQKSILNLIRSITTLNPIATNTSDKAVLKEIVFLTAITSSIHMASFNLLRSLLYSIGTNIFVEGSTVEQILGGEFKWLQERPLAYEKLRLELYETLMAWLTATGGIITNAKTLSLWVNAIGVDTRVEKDVVELKIPVNKPGKSLKKIGKFSQSLSLNNTSAQQYIYKSEPLCQIALLTLNQIIPSLDADNHRKVMEHLLRTIAILGQFQPSPPPYEGAQCRRLIYQNLVALCFHPQPLSPISVSLVISLLRKGTYDPAVLVSSFCSKQMASLERLIHPSVAPMTIAASIPEPKIIFSLSTNLNEQRLQVEGVEQANVDSDNDLEEVMDINGEDHDQEQLAPDNRCNSKSSHIGITKPSVSSQGLLMVDSESLQNLIKNAVQEVLQQQINANGIRIGLSDKEISNKRNSPGSPDIEEIDTDTDSFSKVNNIDLNSREVEDESVLVKSAHYYTNGTTNNVTINEGNSLDVDDDDIEIVEDTSPNEVADGIISSKHRVPLEQDEENVKKKQRTCESETNGTAECEGPSVEEMMSSFIDLEPVS